MKQKLIRNFRRLISLLHLKTPISFPGLFLSQNWRIMDLHYRLLVRNGILCLSQTSCWSINVCKRETFTSRVCGLVLLHEWSCRVFFLNHLSNLPYDHKAIDFKPFLTSLHLLLEWNFLFNTAKVTHSQRHLVKLVDDSQTRRRWNSSWSAVEKEKERLTYIHA